MTVGAVYIQNQLVQFALEGLNEVVDHLIAAIKVKLSKEQKDNERKKRELDVLQDTPTEWQEMLDGMVVTFSKYFDTTIQQVDYCPQFASDKRSCMTTARENKIAGTASWFDNKDTSFDNNITKILDQSSRDFCPQVEVACLKSWYRLLDEFTGMLCFAPMRKIDPIEIATTALQFEQTGARFESTMEDRILRLLNATGSGKRIYIDDMLRVFQKRLWALIQRDVEDAIKVVSVDRSGYFSSLATVYVVLVLVLVSFAF